MVRMMLDCGRKPDEDERGNRYLRALDRSSRAAEYTLGCPLVDSNVSRSTTVEVGSLLILDILRGGVLGAVRGG